MQVKIPHQRSPYAVIIEDRSQEETERQQRCARGDAWKLANNIYKLKETEKATFYSPSDEWVLPAASTVKPDEREFVVDSAASMHMVSKKDLNFAELETVRISKSPTTVVTAKGEVLTKQEATVYVRELDLFVTVMLLEDTPAVLPRAIGTGTSFERDDEQSKGTIPMPTFARRPSTMSSLSELQIDKFPTPHSFFCWKIRFKNQDSTCSDINWKLYYGFNEVEWIKIVAGKNFPNFEMLDAKIASALNKIIHNSLLKKKVSLEEQKAHKEGTVSTRKTRSLSWSTTIFE